MITAHLSLLLIFLQFHGPDVIPDAENNTTPGLLFDIQNLGQLLAQLVSLWNLVPDKADGDI